jgi:hypothetical protein
MLPPGHIAAGYLTAEALLKLVNPQLDTTQIRQLLYWGVFFSFAPDLDDFLAFVKVRAWWYKKDMDNSMHRKFYSHIPLLWMLAGLAIYFFSQSEFYQIFGLMVWVSSWTHFVLDSIDFGIMWLWPFNKQVWALRNRGVQRQLVADSFFGFWFTFLKSYVTTWTFYTEVIIILFLILNLTS